MEILKWILFIWLGTIGITILGLFIVAISLFTKFTKEYPNKKLDIPDVKIKEPVPLRIFIPFLNLVLLYDIIIRYNLLYELLIDFSCEKENDNDD